MTFVKRILSFDTDYFDFLKRELQCLCREIRKNFEERIGRNTFVFSLIDIYLEIIVYDLLPFRIFCHCFFAWHTAGTLENVTFVVDFLLTIRILSRKKIKNFSLAGMDITYVILYGISEFPEILKSLVNLLLRLS